MQNVYRHCEALVREADRDRYLATLLAPEQARPHLFALYAFNVEISLVGDRAREPLAGEARLQWWRKTLSETARDEIAANPVASALLETIRSLGLSKHLFDHLISARMFDLFTDPMPSVGALNGYLQESTSSLFYLAAQIVGIKADAAGEQGGIAYGLTQMLRNFPFHASRGKIYVPQDVLEKHSADTGAILRGRADNGLKASLAELRADARTHLEKAQEHMAMLPENASLSLLPLALVRPYLDLMERPDYDPFQTAVEIPQWKRQWILWRAARKMR